MLVMKFKGAVLQNQETLAEIKNRIKDVLIREYNKLNASWGKPITNGEHDER